MLIPHSLKPTMAQILELQELVASGEQLDVPMTHHHSDGIYLREMFIPKGVVAVGKIHATRHLNIILSGTCTVWSVHGKVKLTGPCVFESLAGMKKVAYAHTDVRYMTVHPTDEVDQDRLEGIFTRPEEQLELFPELNKDLLGSTPLWLGA